MYMRFASYTPEEVFTLLKGPLYSKSRKTSDVFICVVVDGIEYRVKVNSLRYKVFARSRTCAHCGLEGTLFALEQALTQPGPSCHFNLYAVLPDGDQVLMTKDHIHPKSLGGTDDLSNLQTLCSLCNHRKADSVG